MKSWKSILLLALVFFAGVVLGVVGTRVVVRRAVQQAIAHPEKVQSMVERSLLQKLRLDNGQQAKLHDILTDTCRELHDLRQQFQPQAAVILHGADKKIGALLTPEQQAGYESFKAKNWPAWRSLQTPP